MAYSNRDGNTVNFDPSFTTGGKSTAPVDAATFDVFDTASAEDTAPIPGAQIAEAVAGSTFSEAALPADTDYLAMDALRLEARQKLQAQRPVSLGQASRIPGVSPADIAVLMVWLKRRQAEGREA